MLIFAVTGGAYAAVNKSRQEQAARSSGQKAAPVAGTTARDTRPKDTAKPIASQQKEVGATAGAPVSAPAAGTAKPGTPAKAPAKTPATAPPHIVLSHTEVATYRDASFTVTARTSDGSPASWSAPNSPDISLVSVVPGPGTYTPTATFTYKVSSTAQPASLLVRIYMTTKPQPTPHFATQTLKVQIQLPWYSIAAATPVTVVDNDNPQGTLAVLINRSGGHARPVTVGARELSGPGEVELGISSAYNVSGNQAYLTIALTPDLTPGQYSVYITADDGSGPFGQITAYATVEVTD